MSTTIAKGERYRMDLTHWTEQDSTLHFESSISPRYGNKIDENHQFVLAFAIVPADVDLEMYSSWDFNNMPKALPWYETIGFDYGIGHTDKSPRRLCRSNQVDDQEDVCPWTFATQEWKRDENELTVVGTRKLNDYHDLTDVSSLRIYASYRIVDGKDRATIIEAPEHVAEARIEIGSPGASRYDSDGPRTSVKHDSIWSEYPRYAMDDQLTFWLLLFLILLIVFVIFTQGEDQRKRSGRQSRGSVAYDQTSMRSSLAGSSRQSVQSVHSSRHSQASASAHQQSSQRPSARHSKTQ